MKKESVNKFDLEAAFKALEEIEIPVVKGIKPNRENLQEKFTKKSTTEILVEDYFDVSDQGDLEAAQEEREAEIAKAKLARIEKIVDLDAESEEDLLPSYVGKFIIQCPQCMTLFYKNQEDIEKSEENPEVVNINEVCQHCGNTSGYNLIGKVDNVGEEEAENYDVEDFDENELNLDFDAEEPVEDETAEEGNEEELELEPVEETEEENSEEEEVKESLNEAVEEESVEDSEEESEIEEILTTAEEVKEIAAEAGEEVAEVVKENPEVEAEEIKEITDEVVDNALEVEDETEEEVVEDEEVEEEVKESLTEAVDKELDDKLKAHNEYIEYLKEMIEKEEKSLANAKNDFVKKSIQSRIDALKADLEAALPEALKGEVETELPTAEEVELEATENTEEKEEAKESLKESLNEEVKIISDLSDYTPWSGAVDTWKQIQDADKVDELDSMLEEIYPDGLTMTELNDILWFDSEWVLSSLGIIEEVEESLKEETTTLDAPKVKSPARNRTERLTKELASHSLFSGISDRIIQRYLIPLYLEDDQNAELSVEAIVDYFTNDVGLGKVIMDNIDDLTANQVKNLAKNDPIFIEALRKFLTDNEFLSTDVVTTLNTLIKDLWFALGKDEEEAFDPSDMDYLDFKDELFNIYNKMSLDIREAVKNPLQEGSVEDRVSNLKRSLTTVERLVKELSQHEMFKSLSVRTIQRILIPYFIDNMGRENLSVEKVVSFFEDEGFGTYVWENYTDLELKQIKELLEADPCAVEALEEYLRKHNMSPEVGEYMGSRFEELFDLSLGTVYMQKGEFETLDEIEKIYSDILLARPIETKEALVENPNTEIEEPLKEAGDLDTLLDSEEFKKPISEAEVETILAKYESLEEDVEPGIESELAIQDIVDTWESVEEIDEESLDKLTENYLTEVYSNVKSFKTIDCSLAENKLVVEGKITFNSGKSKSTKFIYEATKTADNKLVLEGLNADFATEKAFVLNCNLDTANRLVVESLNYKYTINNTLVEGLTK